MNSKTLSSATRKAARAAALFFLAAAPLSAALLFSPGTLADSTHSSRYEPDWSPQATIPVTGRPNPYEFDSSGLSSHIDAGKLHALHYPVEVTGAVIPYEPLKRTFEGSSGNILRRFLVQIFSELSGIKRVDQLFDRLGLHPYPSTDDTGVYSVPYPDGIRPDYSMGVTVFQRPEGRAFTFSCAACHSSNLFGKSVLGMTNRFPRANQAFHAATHVVPKIGSTLFKYGTRASSDEVKLFKRLKNSVKYVGSKRPQVLGLDTSLAHVALSMAHRDDDDYATMRPENAKKPRYEVLATKVADSKPAVWWNLKYKTRWLSDGSIVSGNPIYTNLLWNEIGRGTDLRELEDWLDQKKSVIEDLTTAAFSITPPRYTDFFPPESISLARAKQGQEIYKNRCAGCHGTYEKAWDQENAEDLSLAEKLRTVRVLYHAKTPVIPVGTDPGRREGMESLARVLNPLAISKKHGIVIEPQKGYVPPPLEGIWARWPYFHNNSAPSLCAVLTRHENRPKTYYAGDAKDPTRDFDEECNGYPTGNRVPSSWKLNFEAFYDTSREGLRNTGHDEGIFLQNGQELLTPDEKRSLIVFLKTL